MNATIQLGKLPPASLALWSSREVVSLPSRFTASFPPSEYRTANTKSIATPSRLEIRVSHSFKRRRHFLTATRIAFFAYANFLPGKAPFVRSPKINRKLSQGSCFSFSRSSKPPVMGLKNDPETTAVRRLKGLPSRPPSRQELVTLLCLLNFLYLLCLLVLECCSPESAQHRLRLIGTIRARACFAPGPSAKETFR